MGLFDGLFGGKKQKAKSSQSQYLPETKEPDEINFARNFTEKGGRFIFCESLKEAQQAFNSILAEHQWETDRVACIQDELGQHFNVQISATGNKQILSDAAVMLLTCEYLIANTGGIMICSSQIQKIALPELPEHLIIFASTAQISADVSEGMSALKSKYFESLPTNITTLNPKHPDRESDFLSYGNNSKNIYLLLVEA